MTATSTEMDEIKEDDEYENTAALFGRKTSASPPDIKQTERKIPPMVRSLSRVAACWLMLVIIMALRINYTSVTSAKLKHAEDQYRILWKKKQELNVTNQKRLNDLQKLITENNWELKNTNQNLKVKIQQLQTENVHLSAENQQLRTENHNLTTEIQQLKTQNYNLSIENLNLSEEIQKLNPTTQTPINNSTAHHSTEAYYVYNMSTGTTSWYSSFRKKRQTEPCLQRWLHFRSSCYMISSLNRRDLKTWQEARDDCRRDDADLVTLESQEEQDFIYKSASAEFGTNGSWIGLRAEVGGWQWVDGSAPTHSFWVRPPADDLRCAVSARESSGWRSVSCDDKNGWICQRKVPSA